jgi:hypothetical protein
MCPRHKGRELSPHHSIALSMIGNYNEKLNLYLFWVWKGFFHQLSGEAHVKQAVEETP